MSTGDQATQHPYSRLLITSIPEPDVDNLDDDVDLPTGSETNGHIRTVVVRDESLVMPICSQTVPPALPHR